LTIGAASGDPETVLVTDITGNVLTVTRAQDGTTAKAWDAGAAIQRTFTAADHQALIDNVGELNTEKLAHDGDGKDVTVTFTEAVTRTNIASLESLATLFGKIKKFFTDLGTAAFLASGTGVGNVPTIGTALGTTDNVPVVTNTSGALKPHASGALGTAAFSETSAFAAASHNQAASTVTAGTLGGKVLANATSQQTLGDTQVRNIYIGTSDMTPGTTTLATGTIYLVYEA
jgi:hypothetical protein